MEPDLKKMMGQPWSEVKLPEDIDDKELRRSRKQIRKKLGFIDGPDFEKPNRLPSAGMFLFGSYPESDILSISTCTGCSRRYKTEWLHNRHWQKNSDGDYVCSLTRKVVIPYHRSSSSSSKGDVHNSSSSSTTNDHHHHHHHKSSHHHKHHRHHHHSSSSSSKKSHSSSNHKLKSEKLSSSSKSSSSSSLKKSSSSSSSSSKSKTHSSSSSSGKPYSMSALQQKSNHSSSSSSSTSLTMKLNTLTNTNNNITISTDSTTNPTTITTTNNNNNSNSYAKPNSVPIVSIRLKTGGLLQAHHGKPMSQLQQQLQQQQMMGSSSSSSNKALIQNPDKTNAVSYTLSIISQDNNNGQNNEIDENNTLKNTFGNKPVQMIGSTIKKTSSSSSSNNNHDHVRSDENELKYEKIQFYSDTYSEKDKTKSTFSGTINNNNSHTSNNNNNNDNDKYGSPMLSPDVTLHQGGNSSSLNSFKIAIKPKSDNINTGKISLSLSSKGGNKESQSSSGGGELSHALKNKSNNNSTSNKISSSSKSSSSHHDMIKHSSLHGGQSGQNSNNLNMNLSTSSTNNNNNNNSGQFGSLGTNNNSSISNHSNNNSNNNNKSSIGSPPVFTILAEGNQESISPPKKKKKKKNEPRKIVPLKERLFDADLHCGVENSETGERCTRSLTCKAHSMAARRSVPGRTLPFDQLIADHKKARDAEKAAKVAMDLQVQIGNSPGTIKVNIINNNSSPSGSTSSINSNNSRPATTTLGATTSTTNSSSTYLTAALSKPGLIQRIPSSPLIKIESKDDINKLPVSALVNSLQSASSPLSKTLYSLDGNKLSTNNNNNNNSSSSNSKTLETTSKIQQQQLAANKISRTPKDKMKTLSSLLSSSPLGSPVSSPISNTGFVKSNNIRSLSTETSQLSKNKAEFSKFKDSKENLLDSMSSLSSPLMSPSDDPLFPRGSPGYSSTMTLFSSNSNSEFSLQAADDNSSSGYQVLATGFQASPSPLSNIASPSSSYKPLVNTNNNNNNNINSQYDGLTTTKINTPSSSSLQTPGMISSYLVRPTSTATTSSLTRPPVQQGGSFGYQSLINNKSTISSPYQQYPIRYPSSSQSSNIVSENTLYSTIQQEIVSDPFTKPLIPNSISKFNNNNNNSNNLISMNGIDDSISSLAVTISNAKLPSMRGKNKSKKVQKIISLVEKAYQMESPPPVTLSSVLNTSDAPLICLIPPPNKSIMKRNNKNKISKRKLDEIVNTSTTNTTSDLIDLSIKRRKLEAPLFSETNTANSISTKFQSENNKNYHNNKVNSPVIPFSIQIHESSPRKDFSVQNNYSKVASILQSSAQTLFKNASNPKENMDRAFSNFFVTEKETLDNRNKMNEFTMSSPSQRNTTLNTNMTKSSENGEVFALDYSNYRSLSDIYENNSINKCGNLSYLDVHNNGDGNGENNSLNNNNFDGYNFTGLSGIETFLALIPISET